MDKRDLVELTIERLIANFERSPESFDLKDPSHSNGYGGYTIMWRPKIELNNYDGSAVDDPNNNHAVVININQDRNEISCYLFMKMPITNLDGAKADYKVSSKQWFMWARSHYRKFMKLVRLIRERDAHKENMTYLAKLSAVFPDTLDKHILKD